MNSVALSGRLTEDPELRVSEKNNVEYSRFTVAVRRDKEHTDFIRCAVFGKRASFFTEHFEKGKPIEVKGELRSSSWDGQDGIRRYETYLYVYWLGFAYDRKKADSPESEPQFADPTEELLLSDFDEVTMEADPFF